MPKLKEFTTKSGSKIMLNISNEALSAWGLKYGQPIINPCGRERTVAGTDTCEKECLSRTCPRKRLWMLTDGQVCFSTLQSREELIQVGYEIP